MRPHFFTSMLYDVDSALDAILYGCISSGIKRVCTSDDGYELNIVFGNGKTACMWNGNRYYAWLHVGEICDYRWNRTRPRKRTMRALRRAVYEYYSEDMRVPIREATKTRVAEKIKTQ
jgi:hypothetical protein